VGAGDSFLAGLLACALHHADHSANLVNQTNPNGASNLKSWASEASDETLKDVLSHALASATLVVMRRGCNPARWEEVRARVSGFPALSS
jgi:fructokinase